MNNTPLDNYNKLIESGKLQDDSAQLTVVKSLQEIYLEFIPYYTNKQKTFFLKALKRLHSPKVYIFTVM